MKQTGLLLKESIKLLVSHLFTKYQVPFFFGGGEMKISMSLKIEFVHLVDYILKDFVFKRI